MDTARSLFHLSLLEASYIKVRRPNLCKQIEFVDTLKLFRFARLVQSELRATFLRSIGFANVTTASLPSETDIHESPDFAFSFPL